MTLSTHLLPCAVLTGAVLITPWRRMCTLFSSDCLRRRGRSRLSPTQRAGYRWMRTLWVTWWCSVCIHSGVHVRARVCLNGETGGCILILFGKHRAILIGIALSRKQSAVSASSFTRLSCPPSPSVSPSSHTALVCAKFLVFIRIAYRVVESTLIILF